jgi:hypothetical protein
MPLTGGMRKRLIRESLYQMLYESLAALGWFDAGRQHEDISFRAEPVDPQDPIPINTIGLADENDNAIDIELGSNFSEHRWTFYVDFFAEKDSLGLHVSGDIQDILEGRIDSIGRTDPIFTVYDYDQATPPNLFTCQISLVMRDKALTWSKPHQKHWYSVRFDVLDYYGNETY